MPARRAALFRDQLVEDGDDIRTNQEMLGNRNANTTTIYAHILNRGPRTSGVGSPIDRLASMATM